MKLLQIIREEVVPLSSKQVLVLGLIIACIFQFLLFYAPALADEAVEKSQAQNSSQDSIIKSDLITKDTSVRAPAAATDLSASSSSLTASTSDMIATSSPVKATSSPQKVKKTSTHTITAYNSEVGQTDDTPCITANGFNLCLSGKEDTIAANFLPFGAKVKIPELFGERVFTVRDRMNKRHTSRVDVWMKDYDDAIHFGIKVAKIQVLE